MSEKHAKKGPFSQKKTKNCKFHQKFFWSCFLCWGKKKKILENFSDPNRELHAELEAFFGEKNAFFENFLKIRAESAAESGSIFGETRVGGIYDNFFKIIL